MPETGLSRDQRAVPSVGRSVHEARAGHHCCGTYIGRGDPGRLLYVLGRGAAQPKRRRASSNRGEVQRGSTVASLPVTAARYGGDGQSVANGIVKDHGIALAHAGVGQER